MEPYQEQIAPPLQQQQQQQRVDEHLGVPVGKRQPPPPPPISNELGSKNQQQQYPQAYPTVESVIKQYSPIQSAYAASTTAAYIPPPQGNKDFEESAKVQVEAAAASQQATVPEEPALTSTEPAPSASTAYTIRRPILRYEQANPFISVLKMNVGDSVWIKFDSMAAYHGMFSFTRQNLIETGVMGRIRSSIQNAVTPALVKATAQVDNSSLYLADKGKRIIVLYLQAYETITINATNLVSMEATVVWEILLQKSLSTLLQGGLFNMRCTGPGFVAVSTEREPLVLYATPERPIITDPHNTILWSSQLGVALNSDIKLKSLLGKLTGDDFQMVFTGSGYVMIDAGK